MTVRSTAKGYLVQSAAKSYRVHKFVVRLARRYTVGTSVQGLQHLLDTIQQPQGKFLDPIHILQPRKREYIVRHPYTIRSTPIIKTKIHNYIIQIDNCGNCFLRRKCLFNPCLRVTKVYCCEIDMATSNHKGKRPTPFKPHIALGKMVKGKDDDTLTADNINWESLNSIECRSWWLQTQDNHILETALQRAQVDKAAQLPFFYSQEFKPYLHQTIVQYDKHVHKSMIDYKGRHVTISFTPTEFTKVFRMPSTGTSTTKPTRKMSQ